MNDWAPAVATIVIAVVVGATLVLRGPVGRALGDWIGGWGKHDEQWLAVQAAKHGVVTESPQLAADVEALKQRLAEVEERLDFTERMLARSREDKVIEPRVGRG